jgi:hypothetical protein
MHDAPVGSVQQATHLSIDHSRDRRDAAGVEPKEPPEMKTHDAVAIGSEPLFKTPHDLSRLKETLNQEDCIPPRLSKIIPTLRHVTGVVTQVANVSTEDTGHASGKSEWVAVGPIGHALHSRPRKPLLQRRTRLLHHATCRAGTWLPR